MSHPIGQVDSELFENAPVAIWHEDFSEIKQYLDGLAAAGVDNLAAHFTLRPEAVLDCVRRVRVLHVNRWACDFYGARTQAELIEKLPELFDAAALDTFRKELVALNNGAETFEAEITTRTLRGDERVVQMNVSLLPSTERPWSRVIVAFTDVTERKRLEIELLQAQKLESLGRFAGGVAHDLNNALTIINGYSELLLTDATPDDALKSGLIEIKKAGDRAAELTNQLLAFSRKQVLQSKVVNLNTIIRELSNMLKIATGERIQMTMALDSGLSATCVDPVQFSNVLLNLVLNARDAMPDGGKLEICTANAEFDESTGSQLDVKPGKYVLLSVTDSGIGMDEDTQRQAFDPFFTTKKIGKGTGLGLSSAFGIIKQSSGAIKIASELARGSTFSVYLPATDESEQVAAEQTPLPLSRGSETILIVEDQPPVRAFLADALRRQGYQVLEAAEAIEGLRCFELNRASIALVITDVIMPGVSGPQLVAQMARIRPELRVLYISGYTGSSDLVLDEAGVNAMYLQKPIELDVLASTVRTLLQ